MAKKKINTVSNTDKTEKNASVETHKQEVPIQELPTIEQQPETERELALSVVLELSPGLDLKKRAEALAKLIKSAGMPTESLLLVNGGDEQFVKECQQAFAAVKNNLQWIRCEQALGSGEALQKGIAQAKGAHILTLDALAAAQPDELLRWLSSQEPLPQDQIWVGSRADSAGVPILRRWWWAFWNFIVRFFTSLQLRDSQAGILLFPANLATGLFNLNKTKSIHYRTSVLYKAHLQDITLVEKIITTPDSGAWTTIKQLPAFKLKTLGLSWSLWFRHYFIEPLQKSATSQLPQKESPLYRWGFAVLSVFILFLMPFLSFDYGMTGDEHVQRVYGEYVLDYFESNGDDDNALTYKDLYNYGGMFDYWAAWFNKYIGWFETYDGRHFLNSLTGVFLFFFVGLTARLVTGSWMIALWSLLFAVCSPRLFGDSMNNPKDIPFSAAYIFTIFHILRFVQQLPRPSLKTMLWVAVGIALAINVRIGGLLLIAYFGLFVGIAFLLERRLWQYLTKILTLLKIAVIGVVVSALGLWWGSTYWPYGSLAPFTNPFTVLEKMSDYYVGIRIMFNGDSIWSDTVPPSYIPIWLLYTSPLFILLGVALAPLMLVVNWRKSPRLLLVLLTFAGVFPVAYVIYIQSGLYDGMRHMLFAYTTFPILAAWGWWQIASLLKDKKPVRIGLSVLLAGLMSMPTLFMIRNHPYQYVYFNELIGGMEGAKYNFDVDYWMTSMRHLSKWLADNEPAIAAGDTLRVATNCYEPVNYYFKYNEYLAKCKTGYNKSFDNFLENYAQDRIWNTTVVYTRYHERERYNWDYGIYYPRFIDKEFLSSGAYPPQKVIHAEIVDGAEIGVVIKRPTKEGAEAYKAFTNKDFDTAIRLFNNITSVDPKNESALLFKMQAYANKFDMPGMRRCIDSIFTLSDRYGTAYGWLGTYYMNMNQMDSAQAAFEKSIYYDYKYTLPYFQLARIITVPGKEEYAKALDYLEKFDEFGGKPVEGYDLAIQLATKANDQVRLKFFTAKKAGLTDFNKAHEGLKACVQLNPSYEPGLKAKKLYDESLEKQKMLYATYKEKIKQAQKDKDQVRAAYFLGKQLEVEQKKKDAYEAYKKALSFDKYYAPAQSRLKELGAELGIK